MCPRDAVKAVKNEADLILKTNGGYGILSEIATSLETNY
jgi:3-deoxy-D-manno-octulosonate 8-phosphate phosphatase KdsC-like HAD superfamily phosphatase